MSDRLFCVHCCRWYVSSTSVHTCWDNKPTSLITERPQYDIGFNDALEAVAKWLDAESKERRNETVADAMGHIVAHVRSMKKP